METETNKATELPPVAKEYNGIERNPESLVGIPKNSCKITLSHLPTELKEQLKNFAQSHSSVRLALLE